MGLAAICQRGGLDGGRVSAGPGGAEVRSYFFALLAASAALAGMSAVYAQDIQITGLICVSDTEIVSIKNNGSASQNMAGWKLKSDPEASQWFDLSVVGTLAAGQGITVFSGPGAPPNNPPLYQWTLDERYRDYDPTDYARVVNNLSVQVDIENCPAVEPTPTPPPTLPVGGGAELPDVSGSSGANYGALAAPAAATLALAATAMWFGKKRFRRG
jgi:hypothetical protein